MTKKITDKMRLDWMTKQMRQHQDWIAIWNEIPFSGYVNTPRQAIDSAIKAERKAKAEVSK